MRHDTQNPCAGLGTQYPPAPRDASRLPRKRTKMLRLLVTSKRPCDIRDSLTRCRCFASQWGVDDVEVVLVVDDGAAVSRVEPLGGPEIRLVPVTVTTTMVDRLDAGLFLRPLPDSLVVVGYEPACSSAQMCFLSSLLEFHRDLAGVTTGGESSATTEGMVRHGGAFRTGALLSAGGFLEDGRGPLHERLVSLGYQTMALPTSDAPLEELTA